MLTRFFNLGDKLERVADTDDLIVKDMAFASESPYERWWGVEILDMGSKSVRLDRLNDGAAVLFNHDWNELRGTHEPGTVRIDKDRVLRGDVRITSATTAGRETAALVQSRVLTKASTGYTIHKLVETSKKKSGETHSRELPGALFERVLERSTKEHRGDIRAFQRALDAASGPFERDGDEPPTYRVMDWEPHENSFVTIPADNSVGVGRAFDDVSVFARNPAQPAANGATKVADGNDAAAGASADVRVELVRSEGPSAVEADAARVRAIANMAKASAVDEGVAQRWISAGTPVDKVAEDILTILKARSEKAKPVTTVGLSSGEAQRFSLARAIRACADQNWTDAGFEAEASRAVAAKLGAVPDKTRFYVPYEIQKRDLTVATASAGGFLVGTENQSFIDILRNTSVAFRMGVTSLSGLVGNVTVPKQTAAATNFWLSTEATAITESAQTFGQMALSPKTAGAYTEISRQLLLQSSPSVEALVNSDLAAVVSLAVDLAVLAGSGASGQPQGIIGTSGVGSVTGTSLDYADIVEFQTDTASGNALFDASGYVTTPAVAGLLKSRVKFASTASPIWEGRLLEGSVDGYRAMSSNQMPSANMLFGDFSKVVLAEWGVLQVEVNPYANFAAGIVGVRAMYSIDVGVRYGAAFSLATTIT